MRKDGKKLKGLVTCEVLVCSVLAFGMDHINNLNVKDLRVLLHYHFRSEKLKGNPKKWNLWRLLPIVLESNGRVLHGVGEGGVCYYK